MKQVKFFSYILFSINIFASDTIDNILKQLKTNNNIYEELKTQKKSFFHSNENLEDFEISIYYPPKKKRKIDYNFNQIRSLSQYIDNINNIVSQLNFKPEEVLVCLDLDNVSVFDGTTTPLEGETTKRVYENLINESYRVLMLTARNNGKKLINYDDNNITQMNDFRFIKNDKKQLFENIIDLSIYYKNEQNKDDFPYLFKVDNQYGYLYEGVFYSGQEKAAMLFNALETIIKIHEENKNINSDENSQDVSSNSPLKKPRFKFKALFMVDDQENYLIPFKENEDLKVYFNNNIFLYHFIR